MRRKSRRVQKEFVSLILFIFATIRQKYPSWDSNPRRSPAFQDKGTHSSIALLEKRIETLRNLSFKKTTTIVNFSTEGVVAFLQFSEYFFSTSKYRKISLENCFS